MPGIPSTIDEVTTDWLSEATGMAITGFEQQIIGVGVGLSSAVYRLSLTGDDVPATIILKLKALDEAALFTASTLRFYQREVEFFDQLAPQLSVRVPRGYGGAYVEDQSRYFLFMEDMGGHRPIDQNEGMELADAERAVDALAQWHATFWGDAQRYVDSGAAVSLNDPVYHAVLPVVFGEGWAKVHADMEAPAAIARIAPRWAESLPNLLTTLSAAPTTVVHGDYRADNILFDDDDKVVLLDFQITGLASAAYDLAYFVTQSLQPDVANDNEAALFDRYRNGLGDAGVAEADTGRLWDDYRVAALFCLVYPIVACRGVDLADPRQYQLIDNMNRRFARAADELDLEDLL